MSTRQKILIILIVLILSLVFFGCELLFPTDPEVLYKVTGTASTVNLTIENSDGGTSQYSDVPLPWTTQPPY
ncbi:MAG: hypothetical protein PF693_03420 [Spirochaetia bacterium]|jgi:hypothetical protein|nr:hypothetical protein [Spirochaetia bacterium]